MREIKFRAWHKERNQMCFVGAMYQPLGGIFQEYDLQSIDTNAPINTQALESIELMQYAGLKDKNGKEIYESDICTQIYGHDPEERGEITINPTGGVRVGSRPIWMHNVEIIGNVHENPDLLK